MTREENIAKLAELRSKAEELVKDYNDAFQSKEFDKSAKLENEIAETVKKHTSVARAICFDDCKNTDDPMLTGVTMLTYESIAVKDTKKKEGDIEFVVREIVTKDRPIDLLKLHTHCDGIGKDANWMHIVQKMNFLLTAQKAVDLGINPKAINDSYQMSEIAKGFDMGKNPTSKTNLLKTLQTVVTAMIGEEYKPTSHDVNYLMSIYAKKNRNALSVTCANHKNFRNFIAEICHRIVTDKGYNVNYKAKKSE